MSNRLLTPEAERQDPSLSVVGSRRNLFRLGLGVAAVAATSSADAATQFLWGPGTSNNGLLVGAITLLTTELNSLTTSSTALSSVGGSSGVYTNSNTTQGMISEVFLTLGAIGSAVVAGGNISGWFIITSDGGTTYENTVSGSALARPPDFIIPLPATTITAGWVYKAAGPIMVPALKFKVFIQNNSGQTLAASANTVTLAPYSMQY